MRRVSERIWYSPSAAAATVRGALGPASLLYAGLVRVRNSLFDRRWLAAHAGPIPAVSIGNLAVGGTGKTPVAAWVAGELARRGARPAIVMRGYGKDETLVHKVLNPDIPVFADPDRVRAVIAAGEAGRDVAVMDDAFQHRRARRLEDVVLISADRWREPLHLLPSGPGREPLSSLHRASLLIVTRKAVPRTTASAIARRLRSATSRSEAAVVWLGLGSLVDARTGETRPLSALRGAHVVAAAGVGDPGALAAQLEAAGASVSLRVFPDHHVYEPADIASLVSEGSRNAFLVCTLKDAVKLRAAWPRGGGPLWYVSQRCEIEDGGPEVEALLDRVLAARTSTNN